MEFFDNALNKAKEVLDVAYKKTNEVVSTEKQKFDVSSLKSKREKDFAALGKIYFDAVKDSDGLSEETAALVSAIKEKTAEIDRLIAEIQSVKNKRICPACGAAIDSNSVFCNVCGAKVENGSGGEN